MLIVFLKRIFPPKIKKKKFHKFPAHAIYPRKWKKKGKVEGRGNEKMSHLRASLLKHRLEGGPEGRGGAAQLPSSNNNEKLSKFSFNFVLHLGGRIWVAGEGRGGVLWPLIDSHSFASDAPQPPRGAFPLYPKVLEAIRLTMETAFQVPYAEMRQWCRQAHRSQRPQKQS